MSKTKKNQGRTDRPVKGEIIRVAGRLYKVERTYKFGTCDCWSQTGQYVRITGLGWL